MRHANVSIFVPDAGCVHRCAFCNQKTISGTKQMPTKDDIVCAIETAICSGIAPEHSEIAFFGGSFTCIAPETMCALLEVAAPYVERGFFHGIRISTRPDGIDERVLSLLRQFHVTAIELGCQSMDDDVLQANFRGHTAADTVRACELIRQAGVSLGVQMMTGLYRDTDDKAKETAKKLIALHPDTARIYPTLVLEGTHLAALWRKGVYKPQTLDDAVTLCSELLLLFQQSGVRVIRTGLHSGGNVTEGLIAGPYHPAFRELCDSKIYLDRALRLLRHRPHGGYRLCVGDVFRSQAAGQRKQNLRLLHDKGYDVTLMPDSRLQQYELILDEEQEFDL